jgi:hypothetical protein
VWADYTICQDLKARVEKALDWGLQGVAWNRKKSPYRPREDKGLSYMSPFDARRLRELDKIKHEIMLRAA